jgi:Ras-related protein Rab-6A
VTLEEATAKSTQLDVMFMETSAKAGHNVKSLFKKIAMSLPGMEKEGQGDGQNTSTWPATTRCIAESHPIV